MKALSFWKAVIVDKFDLLDRVEDVLQGKLWAASSSDRGATKRRKDLLDIFRI